MRRTARILTVLASGALVGGLMAGGVAGRGASPAAAANAAKLSALNDWSSVSAGGSSGVAGHTCGLKFDDTAWCWGANSDGQLGLGDTRRRSKPYQVAGGASWSQVIASLSTTCGVRSDGTLWCWGKGFGPTPEQVGEATTWTQIASGDSYGCGIQSDTTLWCWGNNVQGQLGLGDYEEHPNPTEVGSGWSSVTASSTATTCAIKTDGSLWCWGRDEEGELGDDRAHRPNTDTPLQVLPGSTWNMVVEGMSYTCAIRADGTLWCWGDNSLGELGLGDDHNYRYVPNQVGQNTDWSTVTAGDSHTCGIRDAGELWCWGLNAHGELGIGTADGLVNTPTQVGSEAVWDQPSAGGDDSCATQTSHTLWCWGSPADGQLGVGNRTKDTTIPVQVGLDNDRNPGTHRLVSVSADSATDIWAVGSQQRKKDVSTFVIHGDGSTWTEVPAVNPSKDQSEFTAVKALAPHDVWAVGSYLAGGAPYPLTEHWDGTSWTQVDAPGGGGELVAIDGIAADDVWAVGQIDAAFSYPQSYVEHWNGTSWSRYDIPRTWLQQSLTGVVEVSPHNVWAVGYGFLHEETDGFLPLSYHWNGTTWRRALGQFEHRYDEQYMRGVDATPDKDLWAAGDWKTTCCHEGTRIEHHAVGGSWELVDAPSPGGLRNVRPVGLGGGSR